MQCIFVMALVALAAAIVPAAASADIPYAMSEHPSQDGRCKGDPGKADLDRDEQACLDQLKDIVRRHGKALEVTFRDGFTRSYVTRLPDDLPGHEGNSVEYKLVGYFPEHGLLLIEIGYWEGVEWMLLRLDRGTETKIHSPPHYSPSHRWLFSVCSSDGPSGCGNGMDIVAAPFDLKMHGWNYLVPDDDYTLYEFAGWDGDDRVKLVATFKVGAEMKPFPASIERVNGAWQLKLPKQHRPPPRR
ncbi:MAG: hypothetical protein EKK32_22615 [Bradyrhizobiaceae bacterium]|jgi:hypothetical protein|uniref:Uncharacterized protein n=3 Tax=Nitrobacteraceae TaxID=41294 RepID=A0ABS5G8E3_9BRAD|nr:hypothetical protein [Bradyrhizobium sp.]MBR1137595.1 hypothetical protein [Bradyrhizobium denitrificans]NPU24253.1 hypothetical protein [Bradyrhizobium sp. LMG 8443]RTL96446.1 MAG: hypothetical protein EKK32_22615 [Bradyrhizobiaceae bacterium]MDU1809471.1 hypothetical protein [Bradyrhizobium sp.]MDU6492739.1 hypothetical protein [Bradyrhizobium sp.]